jgi:Phosphoesterase family
VTVDRPPADHPVAGDSVLDLTIAAGATAKTYLEGMPGPCTLESTGDYAVKHNPWAYFADQAPRGNCRTSDQPAGTPTSGALHDDVQAGTLPTVGILIPNMCHDAHNCPLSAADDWLRQWLPAIMQGPDYRAGHLAIVITFDEDDRSGANTVLTTVIAPHRPARHQRDALDPLLTDQIPRRTLGIPTPRASCHRAIPGRRLRNLTGTPRRPRSGIRWDHRPSRRDGDRRGLLPGRNGRIAGTAGSATPAQVERGDVDARPGEQGAAGFVAG